MDVLWKESNIFYNVLCFLITENEKLFDRSDAKLYWRTVLHITTLLHYSYVGSFAESLSKTLQNSLDEDVRCLFVFRVGYLTGWNVLFQTVFLFLALTHDALEWCDKQDATFCKKLRYWRDVIFSGLVVPYTCFVFGMFWGLYAIDRELVFPAVYDDVIPWWFNHCVHTNILVMMLVETLLQPRRRPTDARLELIMNGTVGILYAVVYYSIYYFANRWLYNVFGVMTWWQVCIFQCGIWASSYIFYKLQFPLNRLIHRENEEEEKTVQIENNGETKETTELSKEDEKDSPFSEKSWSLKYRTSRIENSNL